ncbi:hypothetical protein L596_010591 [Steinernema carpocapsae]|uniref:F-actin-capping protein subunit beta n=1 Tax=Steinernema carpocapsae TaxID=34508 RepID=A0A4U5PJH8_STECR|nr:hypothetical protein L596_010591 [Steinernema carpocapsae]
MSTSQDEIKLDASLDLMRRLPPQNCEQHLKDLVRLSPHLCEDLLSSIDQPLKVARDKTGKAYLLCDYNRDQDSYRSPWTNEYTPPLADGALPSDRIRKLEIEANHAFEVYRDMYYEGGITSAYFWGLEEGFAGVVLIKKEADGERGAEGCWDAMHVIETQEKAQGRTALYRLSTTLMMWLKSGNSRSGAMSNGGSISHQTQHERILTDQVTHLVNIGPRKHDAFPYEPSSQDEAHLLRIENRGTIC